MKPLSGAADLLAQMASKQGRPVTVTFRVTERCNYDCVHCYQEQPDCEELGFAEIERILGEVAEAGVLFLTLPGGEFFMRRDADDILRKAHELGFAIKLLTTGHHVTERRADLIASLRPIQVDLSFYAATPHVHETVTRQQGSWKRTYDAARRLVARGVTVLLKTPVMEVNVRDLANLKKIADDIGAQSTFDPKITGMDDGDQAPVSLRMCGDTLAAFYRDEDNGVGDYMAASFAGFDPVRDGRPLDHAPCRAGVATVSIGPTGEIWPCNALPIVCGDLRRQSFAEVLSGSPELDEVRGLRWAHLSECNVCELRAYCTRCHGMALLEQGDMRGPSLEACRHAVAMRDSLRERGLIPATEVALPPTWDRVDSDGLHHMRDSVGDSRSEGRDASKSPIRRSPQLRVLADGPIAWTRTAQTGEVAAK